MTLSCIMWNILFCHLNWIELKNIILIWTLLWIIEIDTYLSVFYLQIASIVILVYEIFCWVFTVNLDLDFGKSSIFKTSLSVYYSVIENVLVNILFYFNLNAFGLMDHEGHDCNDRYRYWWEELSVWALRWILFSFLVILGTVEWKEYEICGCQNGKMIQLFSGKIRRQTWCCRCL